nr:PREDICTED: chondroadherin-like [Linepithema humile]
MIKYIILLALLLLPCADLKESIKFISTNGNVENEKYEIKIIKKEDTKCENLETLNLEEMNLRFIKENIIQCNGIRHINLQKNLLEEIPNLTLRNVPYLHCLNMSNNYINLYNILYLQHQYLNVLDISYQNTPNEYENMVVIDDIDEEYTRETEDMYQSLVFNSTGISLPNLKYLDVSGNHISAIAHDFKISFPQLIHLFLININAFTIDEQFFHKIPNSLRFLHLENNKLINLKLKDIANITSLFLDGNPIENIDITSMKLQILSLSNCTKLNTGTFNTPSLEYLDLSKNNLYSISNIRFENELLQTLLLDYNKLVEVPVLTTITQLSKLSLSYNMIKDISANRFTNLIHLQKLSLKGNGIENIENNAFLGLKKLEYLDLSENSLKKLPSNWYLSLVNLQHLNVNSNNFSTIFDLPIRYISSLQHLSIKNNFFNKISTRELDALPNMTTIYLA